jgi:hypothetical protein
MSFRVLRYYQASEVHHRCDLVNHHRDRDCRVHIANTEDRSQSCDGLRPGIFSDLRAYTVPYVFYCALTYFSIANIDRGYRSGGYMHRSSFRILLDCIPVRLPLFGIYPFFIN